MTGRFLRTAALGLALALAYVPTGTAHATTFAEITVEQFTDASTYIVEGTVSEIWTEISDHDGHVHTKARVAVSQTHKGPDTPTELVVDSMGGTMGVHQTVIHGQARFSVGEDVFLFLDDTSDGRLVVASKFLGKYTLRRAPHETRHHVMQWQGSLTDTFDHRFLPHPAAGDRVYIDDLRERVQNRLDAGWDGKLIPGIAVEKLKVINTIDRRTP